MKKLLALLVFASPTVVLADITSSISSSIKLEVAAPGTTADRIGNSYSVSGTGVTTTDGTTAGSLGGLGAATNSLIGNSIGEKKKELLLCMLHSLYFLQ